LEQQLTVRVEPIGTVEEGSNCTYWSPGLNMPVVNNGAADSHIVNDVVVVLVEVLVDCNSETV
jgi:hypothetical protein